MCNIPAKIINHFGKPTQWIKLSEEFIEVLKAIGEYEAGLYDKTDHIAEEIADAYLMLEQMRIAYDIEENDIRKYYTDKITRTHTKYNID